MYSLMTYSRSASYSLSSGDIFLRRSRAARAAARSRARSSGSTGAPMASPPGRAVLQDLDVDGRTLRAPDDVVHQRGQDGPAELVGVRPGRVLSSQAQHHAQGRVVQHEAAL